MDKKDREEVREIVQETIKMYFDEKQKREKPKDKTLSFFMIFAIGGIGLYIVFLMANLLNNL